MKGAGKAKGKDTQGTDGEASKGTGKAKEKDQGADGEALKGAGKAKGMDQGADGQASAKPRGRRIKEPMDRL